MFKRKTIRIILLFIIISPIALIAAGWIYNTFFMKIETSEIDRYYDLLSKHGKPSKYLVLNLGIKQDDDLQVVTNRLKKIMGLEEYEIWIGHHNDPKKPPAEITNMGGYGIMGISMYSGIKEKREEMNLLVHELGHIYVWNLDRSLLEGCDEEKVVDTSGIYLGLGILTLNGLTDELFFIPGGGEYEVAKRFFGYLYPVQFGYLFARYSAEHGVPPETVTPFLNSTGRKFFEMGCHCLERQGKGVKSAKKVAGALWCLNCGYFISVPLTKPVKGLKCPKCSQVLFP